jgi:hypothetical protein
MNSIDKKSLEKLRNKHKDISENTNLQKMAGEILNYKIGLSADEDETLYRQKLRDNSSYFHNIQSA